MRTGRHPRECRWSAASGAEGERSFFLPPVDLYESAAEFLILADVPGAGREDVDIVVEGGELTLTARVPGVPEGKELRTECRPGDWRRRFQVQGVDAEGAEAELRDGVLSIHLPKASGCAGRRIEIKSEG